MSQLHDQGEKISKLEQALRNIINVIEAHQIESCQCDGREEEYCNCLKRGVAAAKKVLDEV